MVFFHLCDHRFPWVFQVFLLILTVLWSGWSHFFFCTLAHITEYNKHRAGVGKTVHGVEIHWLSGKKKYNSKTGVWTYYDAMVENTSHSATGTSFQKIIRDLLLLSLHWKTTSLRWYKTDHWILARWPALAINIKKENQLYSRFC